MLLSVDMPTLFALGLAFSNSQSGWKEISGTGKMGLTNIQ